jgi:hypothetical protein
MVAEKDWPVVLSFEPTASSSTTLSSVSAGMTSGLGLGADSFLALDERSELEDGVEPDGDAASVLAV